VGVSLKQWGIDEFAVKAIKRKARQLIGIAGLNRSDREDLEQELAIELLSGLRNYDPSKGPREAFIAKLLTDKTSKLLRHRLAERRFYGRESFSLNDTTVDEDGHCIQRSETISAEDRANDVSRPESSDDVLARLDLEEAVSNLPAELRSLYNLLQRSSLTEAAQQLGLPISTAWDRVEKLRAALRAAGAYEDSGFLPESRGSTGDDPTEHSAQEGSR